MLFMMPYTTTMGMRTIRSAAFSQRPLPGCTYLPGQVVWLQGKYLMLKFWLTETEKDWAIATMKTVPDGKTVQTPFHWFWKLETKLTNEQWLQIIYMGADGQVSKAGEFTN